MLLLINNTNILVTWDAPNSEVSSYVVRDFSEDTCKGVEGVDGIRRYVVRDSTRVLSEDCSTGRQIC